MISKWVGTNDTPTTGYWSPSNPAGMTEVQTDTYDADGNLTEVDTIPGNSQPTRVSLTMYDWQDQPVETESGIVSGDTTTPRSITYNTFDNQGEITEQDTYDGTGVDISSLGYTAGVPDAPTSTLLAESTAAYDDQGNVYQTSVYSVVSGTAGSAITGNSFRDANGNVLAVYTPGKPTMKYVYDGADRVTIQYTTDGGAVNNSGTPVISYSAAGSVAGDVVVSETDTTYDNDSNAILTTTKDRLATASGTTEGALTSSLARISYVADYYDAANRITAEENVGTNGGSSWTRPSSPDASDATHLTTTYGTTPPAICLP